MNAVAAATQDAITTNETKQNKQQREALDDDGDVDLRSLVLLDDLFFDRDAAAAVMFSAYKHSTSHTFLLVCILSTCE